MADLAGQDASDHGRGGRQALSLEVAQASAGGRLTSPGLGARNAERRLASYGTLAPGSPNHHHLRAVPGRWFTGKVRGRFIEEGWGATMGFPALVLNPTGPGKSRCRCSSLLELPEHWERLDEFERGSGYNASPHWS